MLFYFCKRLGKEILIEDWKVTINRGLGSVSVHRNAQDVLFGTSSGQGVT